MESGIRIRKIIFEKMMEKHDNEKNWEMLCCSEKPLVPFIGAGISAWCYPVWDDLLTEIVEENFSEECADIVRKALKEEKNPDVEYMEPEPDGKASGQAEGKGKVFHWMEEIAECIFDDDEKSFRKNCESFPIKEDGKNKEGNAILRKMRKLFEEESPKRKREAAKALYEAFAVSKLKESGRMPEYQRFFPELFSDILVTTNYDKALENFYPSIFSYSYMDLNESYDEKREHRSWLFQAVEAKLEQMKSRQNGEDVLGIRVTIPDIPMLLKVHGSIEQVSDIALSRAKYDKAYQGEMPALFRKICQKSTLIFMGCGLREDRILDEMKELKKENKMQHFAFYPAPAKEEEQRRKREELEENYGIYPIFYDEDDLAELMEGKKEREEIFHNYCLGLLLENLSRRKMYYPQPLELLWDKYRFQRFNLKKYLEDTRRERLMQKEPRYIHLEEARQIWNLLNSAEECPMIAVIGSVGSGTSTLCANIQELSKTYKDSMQFFNISLANCKSWEEFCIQIFQSLNIVRLDIPEQEKWRTVAELTAQRCSGYWRSVLVLDCLDKLKESDTGAGLWEAVTHMLKYWKSHQTRVVFTCREYPEGISCYTWFIGELRRKDAKKVFFSACTSKRYRNISFLEKNVIRELFERQSFQAASVHLLGIYANSKNDLAGLLDEWELYHKPGDSEGQILARILWIHLLDEHRYEEKTEEEKRAIEKNILWIWGILGSYPGIFPKVFLDSILQDGNGEAYKGKELSQKTIVFMKNAGLCEEAGDEKQRILLENMIVCVEDYFFSRLAEEERNKNCIEICDNFKKSVKETQGGDGGLECFRGYSMDDYNGELRKYVCGEMETGFSDQDPEEDVLELLRQLGEMINNDNKRRTNKKLNLVLHYEIKMVISFLSTYLSRADMDGKKKKEVAEIGYCFLHYFHYVPNYAYPLVRQMLQAMGHIEENQLYKLANLNRVMGDIQRLLGRKREAAYYYSQSLQLCDEQMLTAFTGLPEAYRKSLRIRASALLISNAYIGSGSDSMKAMEEAEKIYQRIRDKWREADYNQRMGEILFAEACEKRNYGKEKFDEIAGYYNKAVKIYYEVENKMGIAYILKCMGDLIERFKETYEGKMYCICEREIGRDKFYTVEREGGMKNSKGHWVYASASCYAQSFISYCGYINWRGFANVIQAMGTAYRGLGYSLQKKEHIEAVEMLYGLAEECFRWLGDTRGLADTLDYFGYGYKDCRDEKHKYMALSKWMESKEIWKSQGNEIKAGEIDKAISELR